MTDEKPERKSALSRKALALLIAGALFFITPYLIAHYGYRGKVLIAAEAANPPFDKTLILIGQYDVGGAMGIIINKPLSEDERKKLSPFLRDSGIPVSYGGPLETSDKIFVMEEKKPAHPGKNLDLEISDWDDAVKAMPDLLDKIRTSIKNGEQRYRIFTGFAEWGPFQLETEILLKHEWRATTATHGLVFQSGDASWEKMKQQGRPDRSP